MGVGGLKDEWIEGGMDGGNVLPLLKHCPQLGGTGNMPAWSDACIYDLQRKR